MPDAVNPLFNCGLPKERRVVFIIRLPFGLSDIIASGAPGQDIRKLTMETRKKPFGLGTLNSRGLLTVQRHGSRLSQRLDAGCR
jgi:hypothetical protein